MVLHLRSGLDRRARLTVPDDQGPGAGGSRSLAGLGAGEIWRCADPGGHGSPLGGEETGRLGAVLEMDPKTLSGAADGAAVVLQMFTTAHHERQGLPLLLDPLDGVPHLQEE